MAKYESYHIFKINEDGTMLGKSIGGNYREFSLAANRNRATNELTWEVVRHYSDPESLPAFEESESWKESETRGQTE